MRIEIAVICDAATEHAGKLNILGSFDQLYANSFPLILPQCTIVFRIRFNRAEMGRRKFSLKITDLEGNLLVPSMDAELPLQLVEGEDSRVGNLLLNIHGLRFDAPGKYTIDLAFDQAHVISLPLRVSEVSHSGGV
jgi:hypothetical protein